MKTFAAIIVLLFASSALAQGFDARAERDLVQLTNQERTRQGLPPLKENDRLREAARAHAVLLAQHRKLSHDFPGEEPLRTRVAATGLRFARAGENVALDSASPAAVHDDLMHSPPHRANILHPDYNAVGIGAVWSDGVLYVTEDFAHVLTEFSATQMEDAVARQLGPKGDAHNAKLRAAACARAAGKPIQPGALFELVPGGRRAFLFSLDDPSQAPAELKEAHNAPVPYVMGACFAKSAAAPQGMFWVALVFE